MKHHAPEVFQASQSFRPSSFRCGMLALLSTRLSVVVSTLCLLPCTIVGCITASVHAGVLNSPRQEAASIIAILDGFKPTGEGSADAIELREALRLELQLIEGGGPFSDWILRKLKARCLYHMHGPPRTLSELGTNSFGMALWDLNVAAYRSRLIMNEGDSAQAVFAAVERGILIVESNLRGLSPLETENREALCSSIDRALVGLSGNPPWAPRESAAEVDAAVVDAVGSVQDTLRAIASEALAKGEEVALEHARATCMKAVAALSARLNVLRKSERGSRPKVLGGDRDAITRWGLGRPDELADLMDRVSKRNWLGGLQEIHALQLPGMPHSSQLEYIDERATERVGFTIALLGSLVGCAARVASDAEHDHAEPFLQEFDCVWSVDSKPQLACDACIVRVGSRAGLVFGPMTVALTRDRLQNEPSGPHAADVLVGASIVWTIDPDQKDGVSAVEITLPGHGAPWKSGGWMPYSSGKIFDAAPAWILQFDQLTPLLAAFARAGETDNATKPAPITAKFLLHYDMEGEVIHKQKVGEFDREIPLTLPSEPLVRMIDPLAPALASAAIGPKCKFSFFADGPPSTLPSSVANTASAVVDALRASRLGAQIAMLVDGEAGLIADAVLEAAIVAAKDEPLHALLLSDLRIAAACRRDDTVTRARLIEELYGQLTLAEGSEFRHVLSNYFADGGLIGCSAFTARNGWFMFLPQHLRHEKLAAQDGSVTPLSEQAPLPEPPRLLHGSSVQNPTNGRPNAKPNKGAQQ